MSPIKSVSLIILSLSTKFYLYIQFEIYKKLRNQNKLPVRMHLIIRQIYPLGKEFNAFFVIRYTLSTNAGVCLSPKGEFTQEHL